MIVEYEIAFRGAVLMKNPIVQYQLCFVRGPLLQRKTPA